MRGPPWKDQAQPGPDEADAESAVGEEDMNEVEIEEMALFLDELRLGKKDGGSTQKVLDTWERKYRVYIVQGTRTVSRSRQQMDQRRNTRRRN